MLRKLTSRQHESGFTLIELLIVIQLVAILAAIAVPSFLQTREKAKATSAITNAELIRRAAARYAVDVGFYPPDVGRGWDPGFMQPLPRNHDTGDETVPLCPMCPPNWVEVVRERWNGPYLTAWPRFTPWGGKYDYNHWPTGVNRYGFDIPPGIYAGIQRDYADQNGMTQAAEDYLLDKGLDFDAVKNGESQLRLLPFNQ